VEHGDDFQTPEGCLCGPLEQPGRRSLLSATVAVAAAAALGRPAAAGARQAAAGAAAPAATGGAPPRRRYVVEAGWALVAASATAVPALRRDVSIVVEADRIAAIEDGRRRGRETRVDASRLLVLPGFISCHTHVAGGTVTRGIFEGRRSYARALELADRLDDDALEAITALNLLELLRSGCTTQLDQALSLRQSRAYVRLARRWGVRAYPGAMTPGIARLFPIWQRRSDDLLRESVPGTLEEIAAALAFARSIDGAEEGRIRPMLAPHATDTHTPETLAAVLAGSRELGHGIHLHLAQGAGEVEAVSRLWGARPAEWLERLGLFELPVFAAHMSAADLAADPPILKRHRATYATCPSAGGASGFTQPWPEMLAAGVDTNVGIDTHSNDYVENLKLAVLKGEARWSLARRGSPVPMQRPTILDAVDAATRRAAAGLRRDDLGVLRVGGKADFAALDVAGLWAGAGALPPEPLYHLLYAGGHAVRHVAIDGALKVLDGRFVEDDEVRIAARAGAAVSALWDQLRAEGWFDATRPPGAR
jgi:cytosine/adenosine deaminase-related metal-dependent hydrolase